MMDMTNAQIVSGRYLNAMRLNLSTEKVEKLSTAISACLMLNEKITARTLSDKLKDPKTLTSTLFRITKRIKTIKSDNPNIEEIDVIAPEEDPIEATCSQFRDFLNASIGKTLKNDQSIIDALNIQKEREEAALHKKYGDKIARLESKLRESNKMLAIANKVEQSELDKITARAVHAEQLSVSLQTSLEQQIATSEELLTRAEKAESLIISLRESTEETNTLINTLNERTILAEEALCISKRQDTDNQSIIEDLSGKLENIESENLAVISKIEHAFALERETFDTAIVNAEASANIQNMLETEIEFKDKQTNDLKAQIKSLMTASTQLSVNSVVHKENVAKIAALNESLKNETETTFILKDENIAKAAEIQKLLAIVDQLEDTIGNQVDMADTIAQLESKLASICTTHSDEIMELTSTHQQASVDYQSTIETLRKQVSELKTRTKNIVKELPPISSSMFTASGETDASLSAELMESKAQVRSLQNELQSSVKQLAIAKRSNR